MSILLNTLEIKKAAKNNYDAEVLLTFALCVGFNKVVSNNVSVQNVSRIFITLEEKIEYQ